VPDDPRVYDQDNDGNPGVTVILTGTALSGSLYAVQFQTTAISAVAVAPDRMEGALTFTSAQTVLGSDPTNLASLYKLGGESKADPVICNSSFVMVKVADAPVADGGAIACEWVRANETALFGQ